MTDNIIKTTKVENVDITLHRDGCLSVSSFDGESVRYDLDFVHVPSEHVPAFVEAVKELGSIAAVLGTL